MFDIGTPMRETDMSDNLKRFERSKISIVGWYLFWAAVNILVLCYLLGVIALVPVIVLGILIGLIVFEEFLLVLNAILGTNLITDDVATNVWIITRIVELMLGIVVANAVGIWGLLLLALIWAILMGFRIMPSAWLLTLSD